MGAAEVVELSIREAVEKAFEELHKPSPPPDRTRLVHPKTYREYLGEGHCFSGVCLSGASLVERKGNLRWVCACVCGSCEAKNKGLK